MIYKIVTSRNTAFIVGHPLDTAYNSPTVTEILYVVNEGWTVRYSNGVEVYLHDAVEFWNKKEEE